MILAHSLVVNLLKVIVKVVLAAIMNLVVVPPVMFSLPWCCSSV